MGQHFDNWLWSRSKWLTQNSFALQLGYQRIYPSQRQNLLPTLEISNQNFKIFITFKISEFFF